MAYGERSRNTIYVICQSCFGVMDPHYCPLIITYEEI